MADRKISDLTALTTPASGDFLPIVDISEAAAATKNKRITIEELMRGMPDGTAAAPGIAFENDPNTGIYSPGADTLAFVEGGVEAMRIDSSGSVGIGTSSPVTLLDISVAGGMARIGSGSGNNLIQAYTGAVAIGMWAGGNPRFYSTGGMIFSVNSTVGTSAPTGYVDAMTIDSNGNLLVGTSSARLISSAFLGGGGAIAELQVEGTNLAMGSFASNRNDGFGPYLALVKSRGTAAGSFTLVSNGDGIGALSFNGTDGSAALVGAAISAFVDGTPGANDMPGRLVFSTTADGGSSPTERMRIDSSGRLLVGTSTSTTSGAGFTPSIQVAGTSVLAAASIGRYSADVFQPQLQLQKSRGGIGVQTIVSNNDALGDVSFEGSDGTGFKSAAAIRCEVDGTPGTDDMPGRLIFSTTSDRASSPTERMRITSGGNVGIGTTSPTALLDVNADTVRVRTARTPASASATGATGEICWDANYIYVCTATNTWKRTAISTW